MVQKPVGLETFQILMFSNVKVNIHKCMITTLWFKMMRGQAAASTCKYNLNKETNTQQLSDHTHSWAEAPPTGEGAATTYLAKKLFLNLVQTWFNPLHTKFF
jgi:hypothetical protein